MVKEFKSSLFVRSLGRPYNASTKDVINIENLKFDQVEFNKDDDHSKWVIFKDKVNKIKKRLQCVSET